MRKAARVDATHREIAEAFTVSGCRVLSLAAVGKGCPDMLVLDQKGTLRLVEAKIRLGKVNGNQSRFAEVWPVSVVRSADGALAKVKEWSRQ